MPEINPSFSFSDITLLRDINTNSETTLSSYTSSLISFNPSNANFKPLQVGYSFSDTTLLRDINTNNEYNKISLTTTLVFPLLRTILQENESTSTTQQHIQFWS